MKKNKLFPRDCPKECPHFRMWDLSIDDYTFVCTKLNKQIDEEEALKKGVVTDLDLANAKNVTKE